MNKRYHADLDEMIEDLPDDYLVITNNPLAIKSGDEIFTEAMEQSFEDIFGEKK